MIYSKLKILGYKVFKNEANKNAKYPFIIYEYILENSERGLFDLSVLLWSDKDNIEIEKLEQLVTTNLDNKLFFDEIHSYRFFQQAQTNIELFDNNIRCKILKFQMIVI